MQEDRIQDFVDFVEARHRIWERREAGLTPWSEDPVFQTAKFCNVFRVMDYGSQYAVRDLYGGSDYTATDAMLRAFLYRYLNRPEPFEHFHAVTGTHPTVAALEDGILRQEFLAFQDDGGKCFGGAYLMGQGTDNKGMRRLDWVFDRAEDLVRIADQIHDQDRQEDRLAVMSQIPRSGGFISMQVLVDFDYTAYGVDRENDFATLGPGARKGLDALGWDPATDDALDLMRSLQDRLHASPGCPELALPGGSVRKPSLTDTQNCLCEYGKYVKYQTAGVVPSNRKFRPKRDQTGVGIVTPPAWSSAGFASAGHLGNNSIGV